MEHKVLTHKRLDLQLHLNLKTFIKITLLYYVSFIRNLKDCIKNVLHIIQIIFHNIIATDSKSSQNDQTNQTFRRKIQCKY